MYNIAHFVRSFRKRVFSGERYFKRIRRLKYRSLIKNPLVERGRLRPPKADVFLLKNDQRSINDYIGKSFCIEYADIPSLRDFNPTLR